MTHASKVLTVSTLCLLATACADGGGMGADAPSGDADARIAHVESALVSPTGQVNDTSTTTVQSNHRAYADAHAAFDAILYVRAHGAEACRQGTDDDASYDLDCASTGTLKGTLTVHADGAVVNGAATTMLSVELRDVCAGANCVNATGDLRIVAVNGVLTATAALQATVTTAKGTESLSIGAKGTIGGGALDAKVAFFDSRGDSFVVEAGIGVEGLGAYTIRGANGSYDCAVVLDGNTCAPSVKTGG